MLRWADCLDGWFLFDLGLTVMMIWDTWVSLLVRLIYGHAMYGGAQARCQLAFTAFAEVRSFTILRILRILRPRCGYQACKSHQDLKGGARRTHHQQPA